MLKGANRKLYSWIDSFLVFINLSVSYSIVPYLLLTDNRYINALIISTITLLYTFFRFKRLVSFKGHKAFKLYFCLHIICCVSALITNTGVSSAIVYLLSNVSFYYLLFCLFQFNRERDGFDKSIHCLIKPYFVLVIITLVGSSLLFFLQKAGLSTMINEVSYKYDLFTANAEQFGSRYFYPFYLSIVLTASSDIRIPFFQDSGFITGLYHEPHCMTFMTFPALPLMLFYSSGDKKKTALIIALYALQLCLAGSTTNIASVLCCLLVLLLYTFKSSFVKSLFLWSFLIVGLLFILSSIDLSVFDFIFHKLESGSMTYSMSTIDFALKPRTLFGTSFFNLGYLKSSSDAMRMDVGYVPFILNIAFLMICCGYLFKLFRAKSKFKLAVLLSGSYFFAHSAKVAMIAYSLTMLMYVVFLLTVVANENEVKTVRYE